MSRSTDSKLLFQKAVGKGIVKAISLCLLCRSVGPSTKETIYQEENVCMIYHAILFIPVKNGKKTLKVQKWGIVNHGAYILDGVTQPFKMIS